MYSGTRGFGGYRDYSIFQIVNPVYDYPIVRDLNNGDTFSFTPTGTRYTVYSISINDRHSDTYRVSYEKDKGIETFKGLDLKGSQRIYKR